MESLKDTSLSRSKRHMANTQRKKGQISIHLHTDDETMSVENLRLAEQLFAKWTARVCASENQNFIQEKTIGADELVLARKSS